jgi:hypothetical protein
MKLKKIIFTSLLLAFVFVYTFYYSNNDQNNDSLAKLPRTDQIDSFNSDDVKKPNAATNSEWLEISENAFVRLGTASYFMDKKIVSILLTTTVNLKSLHALKFEFNLEIYDARSENPKQLGRFLLDEILFEKIFHEIPLTSNFNYEMYAKFHLDNRRAAAFGDMSKIKMYLYIKPHNEPIIVNIKQGGHNRNSQNVIICAEPSYLEASDYVDMKWFIDINMAMGFNGINIYNNSIPAASNFNRLFEKNERIVRVVAYNYLPNLIESPDDARNLKKYLHNMKGIKLT